MLRTHVADETMMFALAHVPQGNEELRSHLHFLQRLAHFRAHLSCHHRLDGSGGAPDTSWCSCGHARSKSCHTITQRPRGVHGFLGWCTVHASRFNPSVQRRRLSTHTTQAQVCSSTHSERAEICILRSHAAMGRWGCPGQDEVKPRGSNAVQASFKFRSRVSEFVSHLPRYSQQNRLQQRNHRVTTALASGSKRKWTLVLAVHGLRGNEMLCLKRCVCPGPGPLLMRRIHVDRAQLLSHKPVPCGSS